MSMSRKLLLVLPSLVCALVTGSAFAQVADVALTITDPVTTDPLTKVATGTDLVYTIKVDNLGDGNAADVVVTDLLPDDVTFKSCSATDGGVCNGIGNARTVTFASIPAGVSATVTLVATVNVNCTTLDNVIPISNSAVVVTSSPESKENNNSATVIVTASNPKPAISLLTASPNTLWSPNHKMVNVALNYDVTHSCPVTCSPLSVSSNEPVNGTGDGNTSPDWVVLNVQPLQLQDQVLVRDQVQLRAERAGNGNGRIYTVAATCTDDWGQSGIGSTPVFVPHDSSADVPGVHPVLYGAVLPASRAARVGSPITVFATIINAGTFIGTGCSISLPGTLPATLTYQTTNPTTNAVTGSPNMPVDIDAGASQSFVLSVTPTAPLNPADIQLNFTCANASPAGTLSGINTLLLSAWTTPTPDVVALVATTTGDGIANIPGPWGTGFFAVATSNVGSGGSITASADAGGTKQPLDITLCQTDPASGNCLQQPAPSIPVATGGGDTSTFAVFVRGTGKNVAFDPAGNRVRVLFRNNANGAVVGATSVAVQTR